MQSTCVAFMVFEEVTISEVRVGKLKNGKAADKDEVTGELIKGGGDRVLDWIFETM